MSGAVGAYEYVVRPTEDIRGGHAYCAMAGAAPAWPRFWLTGRAGGLSMLQADAFDHDVGM